MIPLTIRRAGIVFVVFFTWLSFLAMSARLFAHCWRLAASSAQEGSSSGHSPSSEDDEDEEDIEDTARIDESRLLKTSRLRGHIQMTSV